MNLIVRKITIALIFGLLLLAGGCVKNEFTVEFSLPAKCERACILLYYASDSQKGWIVETAAAVHGGKAEVKGATRNPTLVYLLDGMGQPMVIFYAERGDKIKVESSDENPLKWHIGGNKINDALSDWRISNLSALESGDYAKVNTAVAKYVKENSDNPVSTLLLLCYYNRRFDEAGFDALWKQLKGEAKEGKWIELPGRADVIEEHQQSKMPKSIVLNTLSGNKTVSMGRVPVLLYFSKSDIISYQEDIRMLRALSREYSDSAQRVICNISFEPDSLAHAYTARNDSLSKAVNAWMPLGISDNLAKNFGVGAIPYFIVVDAKGKKVYAGAEINDAFQSFKNALSSSPSQ